MKSNHGALIRAPAANHARNERRAESNTDATMWRGVAWQRSPVTFQTLGLSFHVFFNLRPSRSAVSQRSDAIRLRPVPRRRSRLAAQRILGARHSNGNSTPGQRIPKRRPRNVFINAPSTATSGPQYRRANPFPCLFFFQQVKHACVIMAHFPLKCKNVLAVRLNCLKRVAV